LKFIHRFIGPFSPLQLLAKISFRAQKKTETAGRAPPAKILFSLGNPL